MASQLARHQLRGAPTAHCPQSPDTLGHPDARATRCLASHLQQGSLPHTPLRSETWRRSLPFLPLHSRCDRTRGRRLVTEPACFSTAADCASHVRFLRVLKPLAGPPPLLVAAGRPPISHDGGRGAALQWRGLPGRGLWPGAPLRGRGLQCAAGRPGPATSVARRAPELTPRLRGFLVLVAQSPPHPQPPPRSDTRPSTYRPIPIPTLRTAHSRATTPPRAPRPRRAQTLTE